MSQHNSPTESLLNQGEFRHLSTSQNFSDKYSIQSSESQIAEMLQRLNDKDLRSRARGFYNELIRCPALFGNGQISLASIPFASESFHRITGAIRFTNPSEILNTSLGEFYGKPGRLHRQRNGIYNRGANYYEAHRVTASRHEKIVNMRRDVFDAIDALNPGPKINNDELFFGKLGVLDYLKLHTMSAFNLLTYRERFGSEPRDNEYVVRKGQALHLTQIAVRSFYQHLMGREMDLYNPQYYVSLEDFKTEFAEVLHYLDCQLKAELENGTERRKFQIPELDHPLVILMNAHQNAMKFPKSEVIVGLPFGGLQIALANGYTFETIHGSAPSIILVPLSTHSVKTYTDKHLSDDQIARHIESVRNKHVLVTEDNSNSGNTAQTIRSCIEKAGAASVHVTLAEMDPRRVCLKTFLKKKEGTAPSTVINLDHPDFDTAVRVVPIRAILTKASLTHMVRRVEQQFQRSQDSKDEDLNRALKARSRINFHPNNLAKRELLRGHVEDKQVAKELSNKIIKSRTVSKDVLANSKFNRGRTRTRATEEPSASKQK